MSITNNAYKLHYEEDGVHFELFEENILGRPPDMQEIAQYLKRKSLAGVDEGALLSLVSQGSGKAKIAPVQKENFIGEEIVIYISKDESEATVQLLPGEDGGTPLEFGAAKQKLLLAGISHGLDEVALANLLNDKDYDYSRVVAKSTPPQDGEDGKLVFHFETEKKSIKPKELEGGRVDYKSLDLYESVTEGQLLVSREYATEGTPGTTVKGRMISQRRGKEAILPKGKNVTINPERTQMFAKCTGMVEFVNDGVNVSSVYKVQGDVDMSVGNIDFNGSVHIVGSVNSGHVIRAAGSVIIGGVLEASEVYSGGNVEIKRGMQGMGRGKIEAAGSITLPYIERGVAIAGGSITVDACIQSIIEAGNSLYVKGKRGSIIGGRVSAAVEIVANTIGAVSHLTTDIEVGAMAQKRARLSFLEQELARLATETAKLNQLDAYLAKTKGKLDPATWDKLHLSGIENRRVYTEQTAEYNDEIAVIQEALKRSTDGKIHVFDSVFPGVRITIANDMYRVNDNIQFTTFKYREGQIVYNTCEIRKGR